MPRKKSKKTVYGMRLNPEECRSALDLLCHQEKIPPLLAQKKWRELRVLRGFYIPTTPEDEDPRLLEFLLRQRARLERTGLYARVLEGLAENTGDGMAAALLRGLEVRQKLADAEGGSFSVREAARLLRIPQDEVILQIMSFQLVAWRDWHHERLPYRLPQWQFARGRVLPGIKEVLETFRSRDQWRIMLYFLARRHSLGDKRPLDLLRAGEVEQVVQHAKWTFDDNSW